MRPDIGKRVVDFLFGTLFWGVMLLPGLGWFDLYVYCAAIIAAGILVAILGDQFWDRIRVWSWFHS